MFKGMILSADLKQATVDHDVARARVFIPTEDSFVLAF